MATGRHEYKSTMFSHAADPGPCIAGQAHEFKYIGMLGVPLPNDDAQVQIISRYYCTRCLLQASVEDHKVPIGEMDALQVGSKTGQVQ